ncbi:hypothetical protein [Kutzneria sp. NPDC052558]|uniref:hypothetical protein n=1 Tax=Kutzneria sp. NPDC052558 TaxID=3364121 RepID=UPI0037CBB63A
MQTETDGSVRTRPRFATWSLPLRPRRGRLRPLLCALAVVGVLFGVTGGGYLLAANQSSGFDHGSRPAGAGGFGGHGR